MATVTKENVKGIKAIQKQFLNGKREIKKADLTNLGFDTALGKLEIKNIKAQKGIMLDTYSLSVIDKNKDFDGNLISENKNLLHRIHALWGAGKKVIPFSDILASNIDPSASEIKIGNILLSNYFGIEKDYKISPINSEKNIDNKWIDSAVTIKKVLDALINFPYNKKMFQLAEAPLYKELDKYFKEHFESVTYNKKLIDLTIGNGNTKIVIKLKLSRKMVRESESQKCRGQIEDYKKQFGSNLILVFAGENADNQVEYMQECSKKADSLGIKSFFMEVKK